MAKKCILVVDDSADVRTVVKKRLEAEGFEVLLAEDGASALSQAAAQHPDAILLDLVLPDLNGHEVQQRLLRDPQTAEIPVILFTAAKAEHLVKRVTPEALGAVNYVAKPFDGKALAALMRQVLLAVQSPGTQRS